MAHVTITEYEIEHDLLPAVCVKCGQPATERFQRTIRFIDEPGRWRGLYTLAFLFSIFCCPPLLMPIVRRARAVQFKVPYCAPDLARFRRHERRALCVVLPFWVLFTLGVDVLVVLAIIRQPGVTCLMATVLAAWMMLIDVIVGRLQRHKKKQTKVRLPGVHPAFVAALVEDRARDRVSNPDRRGGHGDVRDDFDEDPM